jgi:phosphoserine/homoserine phosphotransferase
MNYACIDMEGVLIPEVWPHISEKTKIKELSITSRDIPDYESLVLKRIEILRENNLKLKDIVSLISELEPLGKGVSFIFEL